MNSELSNDNQTLNFVHECWTNKEHDIIWYLHVTHA